MRIKRLYTFLIESYIGTFLAAFLVCLFFVLMLFLWQRIDDLIGKGLEFSVLFKFFFYAVLSSVPMAMPMTILVSSLITFGNLGEKLELLAMKAAGISLFRIMRPFIVFVSLVSIGEVVYSNYANCGLCCCLLSKNRPRWRFRRGFFTKELMGIIYMYGKKIRIQNYCETS